ncbi:MAG TPA: DUF192 domain-containing protein [Woeseiaceae bacterium]
MSAIAARTRAPQIACVAVAMLLAFANGIAIADDELDRAFDRASLVIEAGGRACYGFDVYLALTREQQQRGLMHVRRLPKFTGMLFVYPMDDMHSMWMKNTYLPLDILFIRDDGRVSSIARMTEPLSLRSIASTEPVRYVLELNGGITEELGIDADSLVYLPDL